MPSQPLTAAAYAPKGGIGKTTSIGNVGAAAAIEYDLDVLLIDLAGTQNDLASQFGIDLPTDDSGAFKADVPISAVFSDQWSIIRDADNLLDRMAYDTGEGPDLIPADPGLSGADNNLANVPVENRYNKLQSFIAADVGDAYDLVLFDLPGKDDNIGINGLFAAEDVIVPLTPGEFEAQQLENLERQLATLRQDFDGTGGMPDANPRVTMVFANAVDRRTGYHEDFAADLEEQYPDRVSDPIPKSANVGQSQRAGMSLFGMPEDELYSTGERAREAYRAATHQLLDRLTETHD